LCCFEILLALVAICEIAPPRRRYRIAKEMIMNWDRRIAKVAPYAATAIALLLGFMVFAGYFQY